MKTLLTVFIVLAGLSTGPGWSSDRLQVESRPPEASDTDLFEYQEERLDELSEDINQDVSTPNTADHTTPLELPEEIDIVEDPVIIDTQSGEAIGVEIWELDEE
ncbi:MAG: hypothetical protein ACFB4I_16505 [Cyanophyceae cyanobacterium]